jgi:hypothetical protein
MPALVAGIHVLLLAKAWMAGTSPAMTKRTKVLGALLDYIARSFRW